MVHLICQEPHTEFQIKKIIDTVQRATGDIAHDVEFLALLENRESFPVIGFQFLRNGLQFFPCGITKHNLKVLFWFVVLRDRILGARDLVKKQSQFLGCELLAVVRVLADNDLIVRLSIASQLQRRVLLRSSCIGTGQHQ